MIHPQRMPTSECLSGYALDKLLAEELDAAASEHVRGHLAGCTACAARFAEMEALQREFLAEPPAALASRRPSRNSLRVVDGGRSAGRAAGSDEPARSARRSLMPGPRTMAALAGLAAAAVVAMLAWPASTGDHLGEHAGARTKGAIAVALHVEHDGRARPAADGARVHPGDILHFSYTASRPGHLAIVSRDGAGTGSIYLSDGDRAAAITPGSEVAAPTSVVLDDVLGGETLYFLMCHEAIALEPVRRGLEQSAADPVVPGCVIQSMTIEKRALLR